MQKSSISEERGNERKKGNVPQLTVVKIQEPGFGVCLVLGRPLVHITTQWRIAG